MSKRQRILGTWNEEYQGELDELLYAIRTQHYYSNFDEDGRRVWWTPDGGLIRACT